METQLERTFWTQKITLTFFSVFLDLFSIWSISVSQMNRLRSEHQTKSILFGIGFLAAFCNTLSSSILLIHTATHVLDVFLLTSSSLGISFNGGSAHAGIYFVFLMVPGLLGILIDQFVFHAQPDIIEDDL